MSEAIALKNARRSFGGVCALDGLDLEVPTGSVFGLLGRNGAGKTTALRAALGLLRLDGGLAEVFGRPLASADRAHRARVAYVPQAMRLDPQLTGDHHLRYWSRLYPRWDDAYARSLAQRLEVPLQQRVSGLSGGKQRTLHTVLALGARPDLLVLDEPTAGLDPLVQRELIDTFIELMVAREGLTVVLSTHVVAHVEALADHVGIIDEGRALTSGEAHVLVGGYRRVQVALDAAPPSPLHIAGALRVEVSGRVIQAVVPVELADLGGLASLPGSRVDVFPLRLEDVFVELVGRPRAVPAETREVA